MQKGLWNLDLNIEF